MIATKQKGKTLQSSDTPQSMTLQDTATGTIAYQYLKFASIDDFLKSDQVVDGGRIDVVLESDQTLDENTLALIKAKCPKAAVSKAYVLEHLLNH